MANEIENIYLVNAPAGSGKTTWIRKQVEEHLLENDTDHILCITYTNRAAEELGRDIDTDRVFFGTIHSFINNYISTFFEHQDIVDLYLELYREKILQRIDNKEKKASIKESNERYIAKYGTLDFETVRSNLKKISYGETQYTSLYYGALSHDDLISFTKKVVEKYPIILKKISEKYQLIFIDEYQDTDADVLKLFYSAMKSSAGKLYLLGDKMQQIYKTYDGSFEDVFKRLNKSINLNTNYRTTPYIVDVLNAIYNDDNFQQTFCEKNSDEQMLFLPKVIFTDDRDLTINEFRREYKDTLALYLTNRERFSSIGADTLFDTFNNMSKYKFLGKNNASDVLMKEDARNQDLLLNLVFLLVEIFDCYQENKFGDIFKLARKNEKVLRKKTFLIRVHEDKKVLHDKLEEIVSLNNEKDDTIAGLIQRCHASDMIDEEYYGRIMEDENYKDALKVPLSEILSLREYLNSQCVSTQHGVKGESHDTVLFVVENSANLPVVYMSKFFELWSKNDVALGPFEEFYYSYLNLIKSVESTCGIKASIMNSDKYKENQQFICEKIKEFDIAYAENDYYRALLKDKFDFYLTVENKTKAMGKAKECLKENLVYGVLAAYRLFYVGCSRARRNLAIVIQNSDVNEFKDKLKEKLKKVGFELEER